MEKGTRIGLAGLLAGVGAVGGFAALGGAVYDRVMIPGPRDRDLDESDPALRVEGRRWMEKAEGFRGTSIRSMEGLRLWAAYLPADRETHRWAICVHGFRDDHTSMGIYARHYHEAGWNLLMPDQRGYGSSEGSYIGWGYDERLDLVGWISWLLRRDPKAEILLHGVSMGAATILMATGGALPKNVRAAIADCSYDTMENEIRYILTTHPSNDMPLGEFASWVVFRALRKVTLHRAGYDLKKVSPVNAVERSKTPTLFIHGTEDEVVPSQMTGRLYNAAKCEKQLLWVPGGKHAVEAAEEPALYWDSVEAFLAKYMPEDPEEIGT